MTRPKGDSDPDYFQKTTGGPRPGIPAATFEKLMVNQGRVQHADKSFSYVSPITGKTYQLDDQQREPFQTHRGVVMQRPAMDHYPVQSAALTHVYEATLNAERAKEPGPRRPSVDLATAMSRSHADPDNLRVLPQAEHTLYGHNTQQAHFSNADLADAHDLYNAHMPATHATAAEQQGFGRPQWTPARPPAPTAAVSSRPQRASAATFAANNKKMADEGHI